MQKILSYMRKASRQYNMIEDGDKIAVCLSGGKDSITMLLGLKQLQTYFDKGQAAPRILVLEYPVYIVGVYKIPYNLLS